MEQNYATTRRAAGLPRSVTAWEPYAYATTNDGLTIIVAPYRSPTAQEQREGMSIDVYIGNDNSDRCFWHPGTLTGKKDGAYITFSYEGRDCALYVDNEKAILQRDGGLPEQLRR